MEEPPPPLKVEIDQPPTRSSSYRELETTHGRFKATHRRPTASDRAVWTIFMLWFIWPLFTAWPEYFDDIGVGLMNLALGLVFVWVVLVLWLNRSVISIENGTLSCSSRPIWYPFRKRLRASLATIEGFRVEERRDSRRNPVYVVVAQQRSGEPVPVTHNLPTRAAAAFLIQRFERHRRMTQVDAISSARVQARVGDEPDVFEAHIGEELEQEVL